MEIILNDYHEKVIDNSPIKSLLILTATSISSMLLSIRQILVAGKPISAFHQDF